MTDAIGWTASAILLATLARQIIKQSATTSRQAVSTWLFLGQAGASLLFVVYSILLQNWVFTVTNGCLLITAVVGHVLTRRGSRRSRCGNPPIETGRTPRPPAP